MAITTVQNELIAVNAVSGTIIADNAITAVHIAQNQVTATQIPAGSIVTAQLGADAVTAAKLADSSVVTANIQDDQVTGDKLTNNITIAGTLGVTGVTTLSTHLLMGDDDTIKLGDSQEFNLYHTGSGNSIISESGGGSLYIDATNIYLRKSTGSGEQMADFVADGAVSLYYDNAAKLATVTGGINITGDTDTDTLTVSGAATVGGTLGVTGNTTLSGNILMDGEEQNDWKIKWDHGEGTSHAGISTVSQTEGVSLTLGTNAYHAASGTVTVSDTNNQSSAIVLDGFNTNNIQFMTAATGNPVSRMTISPAGIVAIAGATTIGGTLGVTGVASFADGSASAPSITNTGDTNTGMYFDGADSIAFAQGGSAVASFNSGGLQVVAGNTTLVGTLGVASTIRVTTDGSASSPCYQVGGDADTGMYQPAANQLGFTVAGTQKLYFTTVGMHLDPSLTSGLGVGDDIPIKFGNSGDLQIVHDGSNSYIKDTGTGSLVVAAGAMFIQNAAADENMIRAVENEGVTLYYNNKAKLETGTGDLAFNIGNTTTDTNVTMSKASGGAATYQIMALNTILTLGSTSGSTTSATHIRGGNATAGSGLVIKSDGKVGIGTTTPDFLFDVESTTAWEAIGGINQKSDGTEGAQLFLKHESASPADNDYLAFLHFKGMNSAAQEVQYARIHATSGDVTDGTEDGNLYLMTAQAGTENSPGISIVGSSVGITHPGSPQTNLHVYNDKGSAGDVWTEVGAGNVAGITLQNATTADNANAVFYFMNDSIHCASMGARFVNHSTDETELRFSTHDGSNPRERMYLKGSGKLGLGDSAPITNLTVGGNVNGRVGIHLFNTNTTGSAYAQVNLGHEQNGFTGGYISHDYSGVMKVWNRNNGPLLFATNETEAMRIQADGDIIMGSGPISGETAFYPDAALGVQEVTASKYVATFRHDGNATTSWGIDIICGPNDASGTTTVLAIQDGDGSGKGGITFSGSTTSYNTSSDIRLKDITGEAKGLEVISQLNPIEFTWKKGGQSSVGLIAQEAIEHVPTAVQENQQTGYYEMDYSKLVTPLIKAVQEQQTTIEALEARIATLEG